MLLRSLQTARPDAYLPRLSVRCHRCDYHCWWNDLLLHDRYVLCPVSPRSSGTDNTQVVYPTVLMVLYTHDTMKVGWLSCAVGGGVQAGQVIGGLFAVRLGHIKWQMVMAALMMIAFIGGLAAQTPNNQQ